jgi:hypothetical protein
MKRTSLQKKVDDFRDANYENDPESWWYMQGFIDAFDGHNMLSMISLDKVHKFYKMGYLDEKCDEEVRGWKKKK